MSCGSGVKVRTVECSDKDLPCDAKTKPLAKERCVLRACPQWITSPWEEVIVYMHILFIERLNILCMWIFYKVHRIFQVQRLLNKSFSFHFSSFPLVLLTRVDVFLFL